MNKDGLLLTPFVYRTPKYGRNDLWRTQNAYIDTEYSKYVEKIERELTQRNNHISKKFEIDLSDGPSLWKILRKAEWAASAHVTGQKRKEVTRKLINWEINKESLISELDISNSTIKRLKKYFPEGNIEDVQIGKLFPIRDKLNKELPQVGMTSINIVLNLIEKNNPILSD